MVGLIEKIGYLKEREWRAVPKIGRLYPRDEVGASGHKAEAEARESE